MNETALDKIKARLNRLEEVVFGSQRGTSEPKTKQLSNPALGDINFELNPRKFVKIYAQGMNGKKKFVLLLAHRAKGQLRQPIGVADIKRDWNSMKSKDLLGMPYNRYYPTAAKTEGWIDASETGTYFLVEAWMEIFSKTSQTQKEDHGQ